MGHRAVRHFEIKKGEWPTGAGVPVRKHVVRRAARFAALRGADSPGLRPRFEIAEGDFVTAGQVLFRDRKHLEIAFVSPISGRVTTVAYGPRRTLSACTIKTDDREEDASSGAPLDVSLPRETLLERGMWPAFRTRPFGRMPAPDDVPDAIFVNAVHGVPEAPDPRVVLAGQIAAFHLGVTLLAKLTAGQVFVCQSPGDVLAPSRDRVVSASFGGTQAAGLPGTHVDRLCPVGPGRSVWTIGYQDVAAIGHLFQTGQYKAERVVAVDGQAQLVRTAFGADIAGLLESESAGNMGFLGRFQDRVVLPDVSVARPTWPWLRLFKPTYRALIPTEALERTLAVDILPVPLMRALSVGDSEAAERLGCLALVEEDVAVLSRQCTSGADYPSLLRQVLDDLMAEAA